MARDVARFFRRNQIEPEQILYITREAQRTVLHLCGGALVSTTIPQKEIRACLDGERFVNICKGVTVRKDQIMDISRAGVYTMIDGATFQGRQRSLAEHHHLRQELSSLAAAAEKPIPMDLLEKCTLLDRMPVAFCVIELVFDANGHGVDFIFRYCNAMMEQVEGRTIEQMLNHSFYAVFPDGDHKWLVSYADTALNGTPHTLHDYSPEIGKHLTVYCYQPEPGYCACLLYPQEA